MKENAGVHEADARPLVEPIADDQLHHAQPLPVDTAQWVVPQLLARGGARLPGFCRSAASRPPARAGAPPQHAPSVEIVGVEARGPAARAGLREGDLLVAVNGRPVATVDDVHRMGGVADRGALTMTVLRGPARFDLAVTPAEMPG